MQTLSIPPKTVCEMRNPAPPGQRHGQAVKIAVSLSKSGFSPDAIFHQLRSGYSADFPDAEIREVVQWAASRTSTGDFRRTFQRPAFSRTIPKEQTNPDACVRKFLGGFSAAEVDVWEMSPIRPSDDWTQDGRVLLDALYSPDDIVNIVSDFHETDGKARPVGRGDSRTVREWQGAFSGDFRMVGRGGVWVRMNPTDGKGISDANVSAFRFVLLEFDCLALDVQLSVFARLPLPVKAIISSGGKSLHAWVRVDAPDPEHFRAVAGRIFETLAPLGIDPANRNPSRLSRFPGVLRMLGASGDGRQRLLYLNPSLQPSFPIL